MRLTVHTILLLLPFVLFAQAPFEISYQTVVRDAGGAVIPENTQVQFKFTIHDLTVNGNTVYTETSNMLQVSKFGLVAVAIGANGNLSSVNWSSGDKYLNVQVKINNGSFIDMGTTQLLSVPYAIYADNATNALIADSLRGGIPSNPSTQSLVNVSYNSLPLSDPSIDHVILLVSGTSVTALTSTNYWYGLNRGANTLESFSYPTILATDTTSSNPTFYLGTSPSGCNSNVPYPYFGQILGVNTNRTNGVYYFPLNGMPTASPPQLYSYSCTTGKWTAWPAQSFPNYQYLQLLPNNNSITGFNLQFPVTVTITR